MPANDDWRQPIVIGHENPMVQLVTFIGAGHANADYMSTIAWDFMKRFERGEDGSVIER